MATQKKTVAKKTAKKKPTAKKSKTVPQKLSGQEIALNQSLEDSQGWDTEPAGVAIDHFLSLEKIKKMVSSFNAQKGPFPKKAFMQPSNIRKPILLKLLNMSQVKYLRFYFGITKKNKVQVIFVGADARHNDVYIQRVVANSAPPTDQMGKRLAKNTVAATTTTEEGGIDLAQGCPAYGSGETIMLP